MTQRIRVADEKLGILLRREQDLNRRVLEGTLDVNKVLAKLQEIIEGELENILHISANLSLSERIAAGKYGWVNNDVTEKNFPETAEKNYEVEYRIFHFNKLISSESVITEIKKAGFRPGNILELLKLGEIKPDLQKKFSIVALGPMRDSTNNDNVSVLYYHEGMRRLRLDSFNGPWYYSNRFLGVRQTT